MSCMPASILKAKYRVFGVDFLLDWTSRTDMAEVQRLSQGAQSMAAEALQAAAVATENWTKVRNMPYGSIDRLLFALNS